MPNGIVVLPTKNKSAVATIITSTTVIGVVGTCFLTGIDADIKLKLDDESNKGLLRFSDADKALEVFKDLAGTIREDLHDISKQNVKSPVIVSVVALDEETHTDKPVNTFYDDAEIKTAVLTAIDNLKFARTVYASKVRIPVAGWFTHDTTVRDAMASYTVATKTISIVNFNFNNVGDALVELEKLGSQRLLAVPFYRNVWSVFENKMIKKPYSSIIAGHIAYWDAMLGEFGTCFDHANRIIYDAGTPTVALFYEEGVDTCDVNVIVNAGGCLVINDDGNRLYNFETPSNDTRFNKLETVRYFDTHNENIQKTLKRHKHRPLTEVLELAKADVEAFLLKSKNAGATVGSNVEWSSKNTRAEISAGIIYLDWDAGNNVGVRAIVIQPSASSEYYTVEV